MKISEVQVGDRVTYTDGRHDVYFATVMRVFRNAVLIHPDNRSRCITVHSARLDLVSKHLVAESA